MARYFKKNIKYRKKNFNIYRRFESKNKVCSKAFTPQKLDFDNLDYRSKSIMCPKRESSSIDDILKGLFGM